MDPIFRSWFLFVRSFCLERVVGVLMEPRPSYSSCFWVKKDFPFGSQLKFGTPRSQQWDFSPTLDNQKETQLVYCIHAKINKRYSNILNVLNKQSLRLQLFRKLGNCGTETGFLVHSKTYGPSQSKRRPEIYSPRIGKYQLTILYGKEESPQATRCCAGSSALQTGCNYENFCVDYGIKDPCPRLRLRADFPFYIKLQARKEYFCA